MKTLKTAMSVASKKTNATLGRYSVRFPASCPLIDTNPPNLRKVRATPASSVRIFGLARVTAEWL